MSGIGSAHIVVNFKQDFEQKNGLSPGYCRAEDLQRAHEQIRKISRRMQYPSMEQRMTLAFMQKMRLIRRN